MVRLGVLVWACLAAGGSPRADPNRLVELVRQAGEHSRHGRQAEADRAIAEALAVAADLSGTPHLGVAASLNDLAALAYAQGDLPRAAQLFERARQGYEALAGRNDLRLASVLYNLAGVYAERGQNAQAEPLYRRALEIREKALGAAHPLAAEIWNNLGFLYMRQGRLKEAESWLAKAFEVWENAAGPDIAFAAVALNNLAWLRRLEGRLPEAESLYKRALEIEEKAFGRGHPETAPTLLSLAGLYRARGAAGPARDAYRQALAVLERTVGAQDPLAMEARRQLGDLSGEADSRGQYRILVVPGKDQADMLLRRLRQGEDFAPLAARHSIDPNAAAGGYFRADPAGLRPEIRVQADRLAAGQVSEVFPLGGNWALLMKIAEPAGAVK